MSRHIAVSESRTTRAYRVVRVTRDPENGEATRYIGLFDTVAPARALVTRIRRKWEKYHSLSLSAWHRTAEEESTGTELLDCWVEPVTVTNHPGVRYTDGWMSPEDDTRERLHAVSAIASVLEDGPEDPWKHAYAIRRLADGEFTVAQAREWLGEGWEDL